MKTLAKHFGLVSETLWPRLGLRPGNMSQNNPKTTLLMTSVTKNLQPPTKKFFFKYNLLDWPIRLSS